MHELNKAAESEGWALVTTFNNGSTKPLWDIKGLTMPDAAARAFVVDRAKKLSPFHQLALKEVILSRAAPTPKARKAR